MKIFKYILQWFIPIVAAIISTFYYIVGNYKNMLMVFGISFFTVVILSMIYDFISIKIQKKTNVEDQEENNAILNQSFLDEELNNKEKKRKESFFIN